MDVYWDTFEFVLKKATGKIPTYASWVRNFLDKHIDFKGEFNLDIAYDLTKITVEMTKGNIYTNGNLEHFMCCKDI